MNKRYFSVAAGVIGLSWAFSGCSADSAPPAIGAATEPLSSTGAVLTYHNNPARTGLNASETQLNATNVAAASFGKLFSVPVDGKVYAQPLFVPALAVAGGTHDVFIVATENNSVYAFDAATGAQYWRRNLGPAIPASDVQIPECTNIAPTVGITGTPVIDPSSGVLYVVAATRPSPGNWVQTLHALDLTNNGADHVTPAVISAQVPGDWPPPAPVPLALPASPAGQVPFDPRRANQRAGLLLSGGRVIVAWGGHCDDALDMPNNQVFFGWVMSFDALTLEHLFTFNADPHAKANPNPPNGFEPYGGSVWQSGAAPASDGTFTYLTTGNGVFLPASGDWGDSALKLGPRLAVRDSFTPFDQGTLDFYDLDLSSSGVVLLPPAVSMPGHPNLAALAGKEGTIYLVDRDHLGGAQPVSGDVTCTAGQVGAACILARLPASGGYAPPPAVWVPAVGVASNVPDPGGYFGVPSYFNGRLYYGGNGDNLKSFSVGASGLAAGPVASPVTRYGYPGTLPVVSASSETDPQAVVWAIERLTLATGLSNGRLHAYRADTLAEIYTSTRPGARIAEDADLTPQFATPTVAGGHVYVPGASAITVYGLFSVARPVISPPSGTSFGASTVVSITDATAGATIYYTLDGSQPSPGAPATRVYTGAFVVQSSVTVKARAFLSATSPSDVAVAILGGTCNNTFPSCGVDGAACVACDSLRSAGCSQAGQCVCGNAICPAGTWCFTPSGTSFSFGCTTPPQSGSWYNPARSGWGLGISRTTNEQLYIVWFTYQPNGTPIWYAALASLGGNQFTGTLASYRWVNNGAVSTEVGNVTLRTTSATTGTFSWELDGPAGSTFGSEPVQYLSVGATGAPTPPVTGDWFPPSQSGWGQFFDIQGAVAIGDLALYDLAGNPTWITGSSSSSAAGFTMPLALPTGTNLCPSCTGTPSVSFVEVGTIQLSGVNAAATSATLDVALTAPFIRWNNPALPIARLTQ